MPKLKTRKSIAKRIRITKTGKVMKRKCGQDHFNSHETGKVSRRKRRDTAYAKVEVRNLKRLVPYS